MQHLDGSGAWPSYIWDALFLKVKYKPHSNLWEQRNKKYAGTEQKSKSGGDSKTEGQTQWNYA
jgi:hypothetical protein